MKDVELFLGMKIGHYNGSMSLTIIANDIVLVDLPKIDETYLQIKTTIDLPCQLEFIIGNKNLLTDTKVDKDGTILEDKFIEVMDFHLGRLPITPYTIFKGNTYWGFPDTIILNFDESHFLAWHLKNNI